MAHRQNKKYGFGETNISKIIKKYEYFWIKIIYKSKISI